MGSNSIAGSNPALSVSSDLWTSLGLHASRVPTAIDHTQPRRLFTFQLALQRSFRCVQLGEGTLDTLQRRLRGTTHGLDADQAQRIDPLKTGPGLDSARGESHHVDLRQPVECGVNPLGRDVIESLLQLLARECRNTSGQLEHDGRFSKRVSRIIRHSKALVRVEEPVYSVCLVVQFCGQLDDRMVADSH